MEGFTVVGSRPVSAIGSRPSSGRSGKSHGYHTRAPQSCVDESLFGTCHQTKLSENINFQAPWDGPKPPKPRNTFAAPPTKNSKEKKKKPKDPPLFWSPTPGTAVHTRDHSAANRNNNSSSSSFSSMWNSRDQTSFRHLRHTPTYVDESLFGPRLKEASFTAPWNERKKGEKKAVKPYLWDPSGGMEVSGHNGVEISISGRNSRDTRRPATAIGVRSQGVAVPVWKP